MPTKLTLAIAGGALLVFGIARSYGAIRVALLPRLEGRVVAEGPASEAEQRAAWVAFR